jgi:hypothetical protein
MSRWLTSLPHFESMRVLASRSIVLTDNDARFWMKSFGPWR